MASTLPTASEQGNAPISLSALAGRLGQGTAAGMAVALLYNVNFSKDAGNSYSLRNRRKQISQIGSAAKNQEGLQQKKQQKPPKAVVKIPHFIKREVNENLEPSRGKRAQQCILEKLEEDKLALLRSPPPPPKGPLLDDAEKERLALLMQHDGNVPAIKTFDLENNCTRGAFSRRRGDCDRLNLENLFKQVCREMDEQKDELTRLGTTTGLSTIQVMTNEQQTRDLERKLMRTVRDMQRIHQLLLDL